MPGIMSGRTGAATRTLIGAGALALAVASADMALAPAVAAAEAVDRTALRVCADPNNLPFANDNGEGFENKIAELLARELGVEVRYTWHPDSIGFVRNTLRARKCDIIIGTALGDERVQNTSPYYRSAYCLVYRQGSGLALASIEDPALRSLKLGVIAGTPPATVLAQRGLLANTRSYQLVVDTRFSSPARELVHDVVSGRVDVGILWGPIAGYYARHEHLPLEVVPLRGEGEAETIEFRVAMGVRRNEPEWTQTINDLIAKTQPEINRILQDYGVPLLEGPDSPREKP